ncbi:hypothetical protein L2E82_25951 [Cichorium intybus]|uniref:Uncharacterized protein n=1 Tax=Cichorium intybus TaxID=13427 RepID=A0ACB9E4Z4_CICIN|nr:hypothetical protein L2E82_25951 [Cichorium intybus]
MPTPASSPTTAPTFTPTPSNPPHVGTTSAPSSTPFSTTAPSQFPSSTPDRSAPISSEQQETRVDGRIYVYADGKDLEPSSKCAYIIRKAFIDRVDPDGYKWVMISEEIKQFYWEEFQKKCYWDVEDAESVKTAWEHVAKEKYRTYIYNMSSRTRNPTQQKPSHIKEHVWASWNVVWNSEEFKKNSEQNKKNRRKGVEGGIAPPTHNGGSASYKQIAADMEEVMGQPPSLYELFMFTHTKDHDGKSLDERAKQVHEFYESQRADSEPIGEEVDDSEMFYKAAGGHDRKKRVYGLGSYGRALFLKNSYGGSCTPSNTNPQQVKSKIQKLEATVEQQQMELIEMRNEMKDLKSRMEN